MGWKLKSIREGVRQEFWVKQKFGSRRDHYWYTKESYLRDFDKKLIQYSDTVSYLSYFIENGKEESFLLLGGYLTDREVTTTDNFSSITGSSLFHPRDLVKGIIK